MKYNIIVKSTGGSWTNWVKAAAELAAQVNAAIHAGWQPLGGCVLVPTAESRSCKL